ncbi:hypothetical protein [Acinetobacter higginsii]|uniref:hypothetical protein n=1 Tax=Acinetobacter higginsii TaxID=70347 RepID=UPI001F4A9180|nr:hypothetical protein [Acinetobacter higginsii]MCH7296226.1 hypothetical protein [Acinetobacter higginsii]
MKNRYLSMVFLGAMGVFNHSAYATSTTLQSMSDSELSATTGQALMSLSYIAPNDAANLERQRSGGEQGVGFYKLGLEAKLELNANIRNLQLGCGGTNGAGGCDIDIKNLSLSGLNDGVEAGSTNPSEGSPTFNNGRASTSAEITNPFIEFAIKNPNSASTREFVGLRLSAEKINALLTAGIANNATPSTTDGIQSLSGYMQIANTTGHVYTKESTFGLGNSNCLPRGTGCESIGGKIQTILGGKYFRSLPSDSGTTGITVPSLKVDFTLPAFTVNGTRQTQAVAEHVSAKIPWLPIAAAGGCPAEYAASCAAANSQIAGVNFSNDKLRVLLTEDGNSTTWTGSCLSLVVCLVTNSNFAMAAGSAITDLNVDITFKQALSMIHNIPLTGTGGYLSLQKQALQWPGANSDDIAQKGWWMSFAQPVQLGYLQAQNKVDISAVLPQVASFATTALLAGDRIDVSGLGDSWTALTNGVLSKQLNINLSNSPAATLTLENQQLRNQKVPTNCYGSLSFC